MAGMVGWCKLRGPLTGTMWLHVLQVEASVQEALSGLAQGLSSLEQQLSEAASSEAQLNARLEKWTGAHHLASLVQCVQRTAH